MYEAIPEPRPPGVLVPFYDQCSDLRTCHYLDVFGRRMLSSFDSSIACDALTVRCGAQYSPSFSFHYLFGLISATLGRF